MLDKFNFYDLLGYLLPGGTVVLTLYWIGSLAVGVQPQAVSVDFGTSVFFLGLSYLVGQLVHNIAGIYENQLNKGTDGQRLSERLLMPGDNHVARNEGRPFSPELRERILECARRVFGRSDNRAEVFEQCYALTVQQSLAQHTEIFLALNGLARSMIVASCIGGLTGALLVWIQLSLYALRLAGVSLPSAGIWTLSQHQLFVGLGVLVGFALTIPIWHRSFAHFRYYFATSVYYNFLAWFARQKLGTNP